MKHLTSFSFLIFIFGLILSPTLEVNEAAPGSETGGIQQAEPTDQDREYCASMIRFGKEAFQRGRCLDANQFFRQAIEADRTNSKAWLYYDRTVIFALAEKVEQGSSLLAPGRSLSSSETSSNPNFLSKSRNSNSSMISNCILSLFPGSITKNFS